MKKTIAVYCAFLLSFSSCILSKVKKETAVTTPEIKDDIQEEKIPKLSLRDFTSYHLMTAFKEEFPSSRKKVIEEFELQLQHVIDVLYENYEKNSEEGTPLLILFYQMHNSFIHESMLIVQQLQDFHINYDLFLEDSFWNRYIVSWVYNPYRKELNAWGDQYCALTVGFCNELKFFNKLLERENLPEEIAKEIFQLHALIFSHFDHELRRQKTAKKQQL